MIYLNCRKILFGLSWVLLLTSCFKDEPQNMECDILEAWVDEESSTYFYNASDMRITDVPSNAQKLDFTVRSKATLPAIAVHFELSPGATIQPDNGSLQDFSKEPVVYTVTSEDGAWKRQYTVSCSKPASLSKLDFENYELNDKGQYYVWYELADDESTHNDVWASGNAGYVMAKPNAAPDVYPTVPDPNGYKGACIRLTTCDTGSWGKNFKKPIAAGNLFFGKFNSKFALTQTLKSTEMGIPFMKEPVKVTGYYKYTPGDVFTDKNMKQVEGRVDEPNIYAVFYRNQDAEGNSVVLHGDDIMTSPLIVSKAQVAALPATTEWTAFEMTFNSLSPVDKALLNSRGYNLALVFSSSKTGDTFEGAVGSTLCVDEVEIMFKSEK